MGWKLCMQRWPALGHNDGLKMLYYHPIIDHIGHLSIHERFLFRNSIFAGSTKIDANGNAPAVTMYSTPAAKPFDNTLTAGPTK